MYSMVLMAAMVPSGDNAGFGKHKGGCDGGCYGAYAGCTGTVVTDGYGCCGGRKHGGGFLGHRKSGCCGGDYAASCSGGFLGKHKHKHSCNGGCYGSAMPAYGCYGSAMPAYGCYGGAAAAAVPPPPPPPPAVMPKGEPKK